MMGDRHVTDLVRNIEGGDEMAMLIRGGVKGGDVASITCSEGCSFVSFASCTLLTQKIPSIQFNFSRYRLKMELLCCTTR
jgi:hypothetical protein